MTLWGGRFTENQNQLAAELNNSLPFDWRLAEVDVRGSIAWALALARANVITALEAEQLVAGLQQILDEIRRLAASTSTRATKTSIRWWNGGWARSSERWRASCTPGAAATIRWPRIFDCG